MRERDEPGLVLPTAAGRTPRSTACHEKTSANELTVSVVLASSKSANLPIGEKQRQHRADAVQRRRCARLPRSASDRKPAFSELGPSSGLEPLVGPSAHPAGRASRSRPASPAGSPTACRPGRSGPSGGDLRSIRSALALRRRAAGNPPADHLAEAGQVGVDPVQPLGPRARCTRKPLITSSKISKTVVPRGQLAHRLEVARARAAPRPCCPRSGSTIRGRRSARAVLFAASAFQTAPGIVERNDARQRGQSDSGTPGAARKRQRQPLPDPACDQQRVSVSVVAALDLDDLVATRSTSSRAAGRTFVASVPDETKRTFSQDGNALADRGAPARFPDSQSASPNEVPRVAPALRSAATTRGCACPTIIGPQEPT